MSQNGLPPGHLARLQMPMSPAHSAVIAMPQDLTNCPHERRPGTTVCLHCRHAERLAARAARAKMFSHVMVGGAILGVIAVVASAATAAFDGRQADAATATATAAPATASASLLAAPAPSTPVATVDSAKPALVKEVAATSAAVGTPALAISQPVVVSSLAPAPAPAKANSPASPLLPMVPEGTSPLADSMTVVRQGDTMLVHFDTELGRTRRPEKFDAVVRATLVQIYGSAAEDLLSGVGVGTIGRDGDLLAELPTRGIRLRADDGSSLSLWPITRPGR